MLLVYLIIYFFVDWIITYSTTGTLRMILDANSGHQIVHTEVFYFIAHICITLFDAGVCDDTSKNTH